MNIEDIVGKNIAVHCDTEEKSNIFLEKCERLGILWANNSYIPYISISTFYNFWNNFKSDTCYTLSYGCLTHRDVDYFHEQGYLVYEFEDFLEDV